MTKRGAVTVGGVEVGGYEVERCADGTVRAAFWGLCALLAAQAEIASTVAAHEERRVCLDADGVVVP